jgi:N utilization substance protein A
MLDKVEQALTSAFRRDYGTDNVVIILDDVKKDIKMFAKKKVCYDVSDSQTEISLEDAKKISARLNIDDIADVEIKPKNLEE